MECCLVGESLKTFANAINCLSKVGKDLFIEADNSMVVFEYASTTLIYFINQYRCIYNNYLRFAK